MAKKTLVVNANDNPINSFGFIDHFFPEFCRRAVYLYTFLEHYLDSEVQSPGSFAERNLR
jgi:hypothetical protein